MEIPNQDKIRTLRENKTYKSLGILEADNIKQVEMKYRIEKNIWAVGRQLGKADS